MKLLKNLVLAFTALLAFVSSSSAQVNITTWQVDLNHSGNNSQETILTPANIASGNFSLLFTQPLDGQTYGQVLYASNVNVSGTAHNLVFVGTEHDSLYAFDADNNTGGNANPIWHAAMIPTGSVPVPQADVGSGDISIELGLTETPVIDTTTSTIYIVSKVKTTTARTDSTGSYAVGTYQQYLHALDLATGAEKFNGPVLINPTFAGNANDGSGGVIPFSALHEHMRSAMVLYNGIVYLSYASHSDTNPYHGEIIGYNASNLQFVRSFISTPNSNQAGIWGAGAGPAVDSTTGNMYVTLANGAFDQASSPYTTGTDWGESFVKLSTSTPATGAFTASFADTTTFFTPYNWNALNGNDWDVGSSGLCLLPDQTGPHTHVMVSGGKGAVLYVVDRDNLGGLGTGTTNPDIQEIPEPNGNWLFVTPAYFNGYIYYSASGGHLEQRAVGYNAVNGHYVTDPANFTSNNVFNGKGSGVFISSNGNTNGIVWILNGNLQAYNATSVAGAPIYSQNATVPPNTGCQTTKFSLPMVANGKVYYTAFDNTNTGHLFVSGLIPPPAGSPNPATNLTATATSLSQVVLTWTDNSNNETSFKIMRSLTGAAQSFSQVGSASANVTTFTDTNLSPKTTYYYQILASNSSGDSYPTNTGTATTFPIYAPLGLVAYWNLDDGPTSVVADATGNGHAGLVNGEVVYVTNGNINGAFDFHGTGFAASNITVPNSPALQFAANQSFTLSAWVNPSNIHGAEQAIIAKSADQGNEYGIWINSSNQWVGRGNGGDIVGSTAVQDVWTHVALVQDGAAGTRKLYVNGALVGTGIAQAANGTGSLWMGQQNISATPDSFPGYIDEVRVYNRALSLGDISNLLSPPLLQAVSIQTQGTSGSFGLVLAPLSTSVFEPRQGSTPGQYTVAVSFAAPVSGITASLGLQGGGSAVGSVQSVSYDGTGKVVTLVLTGVGNAQALNIHLSGIVPGNGTADIPFNILWADANADGATNSVDVSTISHNHATSVNGTTAFYDLNCDGKVDASDDAIASASTGHGIGVESDSNLALFGTAIASSNTAGNPAANAFDGNSTGTRWESAQGVDPQSISVDLGQMSTIHSISLNWENAAGATYNIQTSPDGTTWTTIIAVGTNAPGALLTLPANTNGGVKTYTVTATGRFVQMAGVTRTTGYGYSLWEFQVFGVPGLVTGGSGPVPSITSILSTTGSQAAPFSYQITASNSPTSFAATGLPAGLYLDTTSGVIYGSPAVSGSSTIGLTATNTNGKSATANLTLSVSANGDTNLALGKTATASTVNGANVANFATDGNTGSRWESAQGVDPQYIVVDLGQLDTIHSVVLDWEAAAGSNYTIDVSTDGTVWNNAVTVTGNTSAGFLTYGGLGSVARYVRMYGMTRDSQYGYSLYEFQVFGTVGTGATPSFASQPTSLTTSVGQPVTFTAAASGTGPFTYQWLKNGTNIPGATGSTYSIANASASDYGTYLVVITNAYGSITSNYFTLGPNVTPTPSSDTPTMPEWALLIMALLFLAVGQRFLPRQANS